jgi:transcriptional regulator with XRE-family HTH domain
LRDWRIENDYTLQEVADLTGVSVPMLSRVERGQRRLSRDAKVKVARRLGEPVGNLFDVEPIAEEGSG